MNGIDVFIKETQRAPLAPCPPPCEATPRSLWSAPHKGALPRVW